METLDVRQAAALLHMHPKRVQGLARAGRLPAARIGRRWLFRREDLERLLDSRSASAATPSGPATARPPGLVLSARNHLRGRVTRLAVEGLMAEVVIEVGGQEVCAVITRASAERLDLREGDEALALFKSTEVMVGRE